MSQQLQKFSQELQQESRQDSPHDSQQQPFEGEPFEKVSVDVVKRDEHFFANIGLNNTSHSLGPTTSRDEIYSLIFGFIADLRLVSELERKRVASNDND